MFYMYKGDDHYRTQAYPLMKRNFSVQLPLTDIERILKRHIPAHKTIPNPDDASGTKETDTIQQDTADTSAKPKDTAAVGSQRKSNDKRPARKVTARKAVEKAETSRPQYPVGKRTPVPKGKLIKQRKQHVKEQVRPEAKSTTEMVKIHKSKEIKDKNVLSVPEDRSILQPKAARYQSIDKSYRN